MDPVRFSKTDLLSIAEELGVPNLSGSSSMMSNALEQHLMKTGNIPSEPSPALQQWLDSHGYTVDSDDPPVPSVLDSIAKEVGYRGPYPVTDESLDLHLTKFPEVSDNPSSHLIDWLNGHGYNVGAEVQESQVPAPPTLEPKEAWAAPSKSTGRTGSRAGVQVPAPPVDNPLSVAAEEAFVKAGVTVTESVVVVPKKTGRTGSRSKSVPPAPATDKSFSESMEQALAKDTEPVKAPEKTHRKNSLKDVPKRPAKKVDAVEQKLRAASKTGPDRDYSELWVLHKVDVAKINELLKAGNVVSLTPKSTGVSVSRVRKVQQVWINRRGRIKTQWKEEELPAVKQMEEHINTLDLPKLISLLKKSQVRPDQVKKGASASTKPFPLYNLLRTVSEDGNPCPDKVLKMRSKILLKRWAASQVSGCLIYY